MQDGVHQYLVNETDQRSHGEYRAQRLESVAYDYSFAFRFFPPGKLFIKQGFRPKTSTSLAARRR